MQNERFIKNLKIIIEMTIDSNNKLYEQILKKRYLKQKLY